MTFDEHVARGIHESAYTPTAEEFRELLEARGLDYDEVVASAGAVIRGVRKALEEGQDAEMTARITWFAGLVAGIDWQRERVMRRRTRARISPRGWWWRG
jgi:hypothetical protein